MNTETFSLATVIELNKSDAKKYIDKFFIPLDNGLHAFYRNGKYTIVDKKLLMDVYFSRLPAEIIKYYFKEKIDIKRIVCDINKPLLEGDEINLCGQKMHSYVPYASFDEETKKGVELMLYHILNVICNNSKESYNYVVKWFANALRGNKNDTAIYMKGPQGVGKSCLIEFIRDHVIGRDLCCIDGSGPLKTRFNAVLSGKLFAMFEELENFSVNEWSAISSVLKRQITCPTIMIEDKNEKRIEQPNMNNYILLSNNDAIKDDDGRRYFITDLNCSRVFDKEYFNNLFDTSINNKVGHAFYCYMLEVDLTGFKPQSFPITSSKLDSLSKRLDNVYCFLRDEYILTEKDIKTGVQDLYDSYCDYCLSNKNQMKTSSKTKIDFNKHLEYVGIRYVKSNGKNVFKVSLEQLKDIAAKRHWVHELDERNVTEEVDVSEFEYGIHNKDKFYEVKDEPKKETKNEEKEIVVKLKTLKSNISKTKTKKEVVDHTKPMQIDKETGAITNILETKPKTKTKDEPIDNPPVNTKDFFALI